MRIFNIDEAAVHLSQLVDEAARGESFAIAKEGKPLVQVTRVAATHNSTKQRLGFMKGRYTVPEDFDTMFDTDIEQLFYSKKER